jgi:3-oxoacyl-[acyl-carrier-protein] synthase-1
MNLQLSLRACGLVTALGYNAPSTLAALRAGISGVRTQAWADLEGGEPYRCARVDLPQRWGGVALLADLLSPAIHECLQGGGAGGLAEIPLLVGVSHPSRPGRAAHIEVQLLAAVAERLETRLHPDSRTFAAGQTGCAQALAHARELIASGRASHVLVAGVDSYIDRETLRAYDQQRRLLCTGNSNGFLPGEAGAAVLVSAHAAGAAEPYVASGGQAVEAATIESTSPLRGQGLAQAVRQAMSSAGATMGDMAFRLSDLSGEHYKFKEALLVAMRLDRSERAQPLPMWHPIEHLGEVGAAILPCLLAWAAHAMREGYAPGGRALCHVGSDTGERAALVVRAA